MSNVVIGGTASGATALPVANTIDPVNDYIPIYTNSVTATQAINRNTYLGLGSAPVGLTDSQSLTNKTLTSPIISGPTLSGTISGTYTIGGTPTFPSSVVTLTGTQTLTNKVLTSPTINSPTITNATLSSDTITGYTTSNAGTIYGIAVSGGAISSSSGLGTGVVTSTQLAAGSVLPVALDGNATTSWTWVSYTPTWTAIGIGNATVVARYCQVGKIVHYRGEVTFGSTSTYGSGPTISLPVATTATGYLTADQDVIGVGTYARQGVGAYLIGFMWNSTTSMVLYTYGSASTYLNLASVTSSVPNTWSNTDTLTWNVTYEAAS